MFFDALDFIENKAPFDDLRQAYPKSRSTSGEIQGDRVYDNSLVVSVTKFESTRLASCVVPIASMDNSLATGAELSSELAGDSLVSVLVI